MVKAETLLTISTVVKEVGGFDVPETEAMPVPDYILVAIVGRLDGVFPVVRESLK